MDFNGAAKRSLVKGKKVTGLGATLADGFFKQLLLGNGIKSFSLLTGLQTGEKAVVRWPHRVQGETLVGVHRLETVGLFASSWSQKEGHSGRRPPAKKQGAKQPHRRCAAPPLAQGRRKKKAANSFHNSRKNCGKPNHCLLMSLPRAAETFEHKILCPVRGRGGMERLWVFSQLSWDR